MANALSAPTMNELSKSFWALPQQRSLPEMVAERIVEAIQSGELRPGERIVESKLARDLGVSRGPLREALKSLEARQLVENRRGRGTYVTHVTAEDLLHMVGLRAGLEGFAARFVATRLTEPVVAALTGLLVEARQAAEEGRTSDWRDLDWRFHETVVAAAENPFLLSAWRSIGSMVRLFLHTHPVFVHDVQTTLANHDHLFDALKSGDPDLSERLFRRVILASAFRRFGQDLPPALASFDQEKGARPTGRTGARREPGTAPSRGPGTSHEGRKSR